MEKRRANRYKKRLIINFGIEEARHLGFVEDLSSTGLRIKTNNVFKPGSTLKLELIDKDTNISMKAEGIVTWARKVPPELIQVTRCGMGVAFLKMDANLVHYFQEKEIK